MVAFNLVGVIVGVKNTKGVESMMMLAKCLNSNTTHNILVLHTLISSSELCSV